LSSPSQKPTSYRLRLAEHAEVVVWFATERGKVVSYSVVLLALHDGRWQTIRVYDNAHGQNEMHRHSASSGKQPAEAFSQESEFGEAMRAAREAVLAGYDMMIEAWQR
jgi:hypothetical protein